ncbi:hypothetical protein AWB91_11390 [Mycobacterium paraense]|uniref:Uncharacterized protein n=1 Tax=Mycobacterium paraense TaxID=767916 RepID=A0ABX3VRX1_9MYCO|nr:hypothetical protein AWB91_11390 [Mycobacterium paraense]ORW37886.1 hypothetical protein AWB88_01275 [Mycobacterium paraense]
MHVELNDPLAGLGSLNQIIRIPIRLLLALLKDVQLLRATHSAHLLSELLRFLDIEFAADGRSVLSAESNLHAHARPDHLLQLWRQPVEKNVFPDFTRW